ncbi:binuclear zinc cluster transcription factor [Fusarium beomiforme]|uniref:Binuclear zinc cluster transcription factor n=1 Tax=Fusarium beomiforme TaxID=44412 RepID=A0A9P5AUD3_9HYPO|nr:binuclear zinc cluster transcription factor [Fusarium beomiforme]
MTPAPPAPTPLASDSAATPEKNASNASTAKLRSCVVCRSRKVRCDKLSPCSNCRRANIPCVLPSNDRPPRWARRLGRIADNGQGAAGQNSGTSETDQVMNRLRTLENLVKELSGQLEVANATASRAASSDAPSPQDAVKDAASPSSTSTASDVQKHFGRMVIKDKNREKYVASGFWSRISDEIQLDGLKMDTRRMADEEESSEDEDFPESTPSTQELYREPSERHAFLFRHSQTSASPDEQDFSPLPSQIPFLLDVFDDNVNLIMHILHMPSIRKMVRPSPGTAAKVSLKHQALLFSIYYAAITSMEDDDVLANFGSTKTELNMKFRRGLEQALARADFLNNPDIILVQALVIFLSLARRYDSPVYVWMMTGLMIRMAHAVGLHRDGSRFQHLSPFEVEQRRRLWWTIITVDIRASEDQGTEFSITQDSFDTKMPLNVNISDIEPDTKEMPPERKGVTDLSFALTMCELAEVSRKLMASSIHSGGPTLEEQTRLLNCIRERLENGYLFQSVNPDDIANWVGKICARLVLSKLTLLVYLPSLFASPNERFSDEVRDKLLVAAIEVAEHNHALNAETKARQWRWIYQTYTHWYAIVWLLIEISRRQWSPTVERAWVALHSVWLIPSQHNMTKNARMWVPLRSLMAKARSHRDEQLAQIRDHAALIEPLEKADQSLPIPVSPESSQDTIVQQRFLEHWRSVVGKAMHGASEQPFLQADDGGTARSATNQVIADNASQWPNPSFDFASHHPGLQLNTPAEMMSTTDMSAFPQTWADGQSGDAGIASWLWTDIDQSSNGWADIDVNMDIDTDVNWNSWLQSATGMELNTGNAGPS